MLTPSLYKGFFSDWQLASIGGATEVNDFRYGDSVRVIEAQRSDISYPLLWAEFPEYRYTYHQGGFMKNLFGGFMLIKECPPDDYTSQDNAINDMLVFAEQIIKDMKAEGYVRESDTFSIEPVAGQMTDYMYGCRVEFQLKNNDMSNFC
jgi:hypothetical protein